MYGTGVYGPDSSKMDFSSHIEDYGGGDGVGRGQVVESKILVKDPVITLLRNTSFRSRVYGPEVR